MRQAGMVRCALVGLLALSGGAARAQNVNALFPNTPPQTRIMIYAGANYRGKSLSLGSQMADLSAVKMGQVGSFIIQAGRWQLCSKPGYQGRCGIYDQSSRDVGKLGITRQIMSIRRVDA